PAAYGVDIYHPSVVGQQCHILFEIRAADTIEDDVDRPGRQLLAKVVRFVIDAFVGTKTFTEITFLARPRCGVNLGTKAVRKLNRGAPYPATPAVYQHGFPRLQFSQLEQIMPNRKHGFGETRRSLHR